MNTKVRHAATNKRRAWLKVCPWALLCYQDAFTLLPMLRLCYVSKKYPVLSLLLFLTPKALSEEKLKKQCYPSTHDEEKNPGKQVDIWHVETTACLIVR